MGEPLKRDYTVSYYPLEINTREKKLLPRAIQDENNLCLELIR